MPAESELMETLTKKVGDLPIWAWGLIGAAGIGVGFFILKKTKPIAAIPTTPTDTSGGVVTSGVGDMGTSGTGSSQSTVAGQVSNPQVNPGGVPTVAPGSGYSPILDSNGNLVGWQNTPTNVPPPVPPPSQSPGDPYHPLLTANPFPKSMPWGATTTINGVTYITGPGSGNILWGVPNTVPGAATLATWNNIPIAIGFKQVISNVGYN